MASGFPLQSLLDHTRHRMNAGERLLLMIKRKEEGARRRLEELETYRREYHGRLTDASQGGMSIQMLREFHIFLGKLQTAIQQQSAEVDQLHTRWQTAHGNWLDLRRKVKSYEVLAERHMAMERRRQERREQGQSDEMAGRKAAVSQVTSGQ